MPPTLAALPAADPFPWGATPSRTVVRALPAIDPAALWRADTMSSPVGATHASGYPALDAELPGGGWPARGLTELLLAQSGSGELRLLSPVLRQLGDRPVLWIAPPLQPYAPALQQLGLGLDELVWLTPTSATDAVWAAEQALRAGCCAAVLWWGDAPPAAWRRLHLAAQDGGCPLWAFRPVAARDQSSPAPLRLLVEPAPGGQLAVHAFKRRGPAMAAPLLLTLPAALPPLRRAVTPSAGTVLPAPGPSPAAVRPGIGAAASPLPSESAHAVVGGAPALAAA